MLLKTAYVRFYRAFNYDYLRKRDSDARPDPWDTMEDGSFYPYIRVAIDPEITCVAGANESGKSQLLSAIECAVGSRSPRPADFCRYSRYFDVSDEMRIPQFGLRFDSMTPDESSAIARALQLSEPREFSTFSVFRTNKEKVAVYLDNEPVPVSDAKALAEVLPEVLRIEADRAIPNSVPISFLSSGRDWSASTDPALTRSDRWGLLDAIVGNAGAIRGQLGNHEALAQTIQQIFAGVSGPEGRGAAEEESHRSQLDLAYDLLVSVGGIKPWAFQELESALRENDEGLANGLVASMNAELENSLNLARWWSQDPRFRLAITPRDLDLVFTIRDRTGSEYSFAERSDGLRYFLSYLVQFLTHMKERKGSEILLMDEPDAYLSNQGQQDLLSLLQEFAVPAEDVPGGQVLFVTHSPFLIDKNRSDRIRVLEKGTANEGVRVVQRAGHNHYEPLRTALGSFVGETAFIGSCNLILEGTTDQVFLAGMASLLKREGEVASADLLDLNQATLVPAGSASQVPYMVHLARGRDVDKPAVIALLDGDPEGDIAVKKLQRGGPHHKQLLPRKYIAQIGVKEMPDISSDRPNGPVVIEDLVPVRIAISAAERYLKEVGLGGQVSTPPLKDTTSFLSKSVGILGAVQDALSAGQADLELDKLGFARHAVAVCADQQDDDGKMMRARFAALFRLLASMQRDAVRERQRISISSRVDREITSFGKDVLPRATKADLANLLDHLESIIDLDAEGDAIAAGIRRLRGDLDLDHGRNERLKDTEAVAEQLRTLRYAEALEVQSDSRTQEGLTYEESPETDNLTEPEGDLYFQGETEHGE